MNPKCWQWSSALEHLKRWLDENSRFSVKNVCTNDSVYGSEESMHWNDNLTRCDDMRNRLIRIGETVIDWVCTAKTVHNITSLFAREDIR